MTDLRGKSIAILATHGFEQSELLEPLDKLEQAGAEVHIVSPEPGEIRGWDKKNWGKSVPVDRTLSQVRVEDYDALVLPGGQINPDVLRTKKEAVSFVRDFAETGKPLAAICHGPWMLIEAGVIRGRRATSYPSIQTDMKNAGADWTDQALVVDGNIITSRNPGDLPSFIEGVARAAKEGMAAVRT